MADSDDIIDMVEGDNFGDSPEQEERDFTQLGQTEEDIDERIELIKSTAGGFKAGMMIPWAGLLANIPDGWLLCDGSAISRSVNSDLFTAIGTGWGAGDGSTTFALPNFTQRFIQGIDTATTEPGTTGGATNKTTSSSGEGPTNAASDSARREALDHTHTISDIRPKFAEVAMIIKT